MGGGSYITCERRCVADPGPQLDSPAAGPLGHLVKGGFRVTESQLAVLVQPEREQLAVLCRRVTRVSQGVKIHFWACKLTC